LHSIVENISFALEANVQKTDADMDSIVRKSYPRHIIPLI